MDRAPGLGNPESNDWNPESKTEIEYLQSGIHGVEFRMQDCLGFPYLGREENYPRAITAKSSLQ